MTRYTIDPANFTDSQWEEFYNASMIMPRTFEARHNAKPFKRDKKFIRLSIGAIRNRAEEVRELHADEAWAADLEAVADQLEALIGPDRLTRKDAASRLWDLLHSDIYTDAPEYADRVEEIHALAEIVLIKRSRRATAK